MKRKPEPWRVKTVEPIRLLSREERQRKIEEASYNVFLIKARDVFIDMLTDSGTSAMSANQWAGIMIGDESYAGCNNFLHFEDTVRSITGYRNIIPTHQGRGAENVFFSTLLKQGDIVPNNNHFDTTRANVEMNGGIALDFVIEEGKSIENNHPFKGNIDIGKLDDFISKNGSDNIPVIYITVTNNSGGGQPVSMENIRMTGDLAKKYNIPFFLDGCRFAENAYFIKKREQDYKDKTIKQIVSEMFSYADGCTVSAKKDGLANIGGFIALKDEELFEQLKIKLILVEGFPSYGGLAGRDLEAIARGLEEVQDEAYLSARIGQVGRFGNELKSAGIPVIYPIGGHAVYVDAKSFLDHIPQSEFPGQALTAELYVEGGVRGVEIGSVMFASKNKETGETVYPGMELVRLAVPRRVYTDNHIDWVVESLKTLWNRRADIPGLKIIYEAPFLRHFTAKFSRL